MRLYLTFPALLLLAIPMMASAQIAPADAPAQDASPAESSHDFRYTLTVINDATLDTDLTPPLPAQASPLLHDPSVTLFLNQLLLEPSFTFRYRSRWSIASSVVGLAD